MLSVSVSEARGKFTEILDRVGHGKERIAVGDEGALLAVLVPVEDLGLLEGHGGPALPDGEQRFRDFAETASDWFWETDMEQRFTYYSGSGPLDNVLDLKHPSSIIGKTRHEVWRSREDPDLIDTIADYMARGAAFSGLEISHRDPERGLVHISLSGKPVTDDRGNVVAYRGTGRDITERKRAEEEARDSRDRIRLIADNLPVFIAYFDTEQRFRFVNKTAREWYARPVEDILGRTIREIIGPEAHDQLGANPEAALAGEEQRFEKNRNFPDGNPRVVEISYVPHFDDDGKVQGCFALVHDITERKRAEQALQESEALFRAFVDNAPSEVFIRDARGRFVLVNRAWEKAQGMPSARAIGLTVHDVFPRDRAEAFAAQDRMVRQTGKVLDKEVEFPSDDGIMYFRTIKFPIPDAGGGPAVVGGIAIDITERKRAEKALQESEGRFRDFAEAASDWFWETDADHRFTWLSDRVEDITGVPVGFHIGKSRLELAADRAEQEKWRAHLETLEARRAFHDFHYVRRGHDGRLQHMSSSGVPVFDAEGNFKGYRGTGTDISAEVKADERAASAQKQFMAAIESVSDGFALFDADDRMVFCNSRFKELNPDLAPKIVPGISFEEMLRDNIAANRILDALGDEEAFVRRRMEQHQNPSGPMVQQRQDGHWLELREERMPEGSTFLVNTDITERKRAEDLVRESEARLSKATEMAKIGYWVWDEIEDKAIYCSEELAKMYGVASGEDLAAILCSHAADLEWVHPEDREYFDQTVEKSNAAKSGYDIEYRIINSRGEIRHLRVIEKPTVDQHGEIIRSNGVAHDITERKQAEEEIRELNAELERRVEERTAELRAAQADLLRQERLATLGQLTATVSHELRNPLGVIRTSVFVVRDGLDEAPARVARSLERIERSVIRCDRIIDEMLDFTRISELEFETTPIDTWLAGVLEEQVVPRGVTVHNEFALSGVGVGLDRDRLRRAVINVFDNACQAMIAGASERSEIGEHRLTVRTGAAAGRIELVFEDTGPGIPPEVLPRVFEPLFSTKGFGVGLGLSVVHQIMEQHGGGVEIENIAGGGARVRLWLPGDEPGP